MCYAHSNTSITSELKTQTCKYSFLYLRQRILLGLRSGNQVISGHSKGKEFTIKALLTNSSSH
jgi:hypothetical protein